MHAWAVRLLGLSVASIRRTLGGMGMPF